MRFVFGRAADEPHDEHYNRSLRTLVNFFVTARVLRDEVVLGIGRDDRLDAAALMSWPRVSGPPELDQIRQRVWKERGDDSEGVGLTTEDAGNVPLYEHFGYRLLDRLEVAPGLTTWGLFRDDSPVRPGPLTSDP